MRLHSGGVLRVLKQPQGTARRAPPLAAIAVAERRAVRDQHVRLLRDTPPPLRARLAPPAGNTKGGVSVRLEGAPGTFIGAER